MSAKARFCQNNMAAAEGASISASSELVGYEASEAIELDRFRLWKPSGSFRVTSANNKIYINDGSNKTVTLTAAVYTTPALMASHIQTQLNASSSSWTCTYSTTTFKFTIGRASGTSTLRFTQTSSAAWDTLGYTGTADVSAGTGLEADEIRCHTSERYRVDLGRSRQVTAFHMFGPSGSDFTISDTATLKLYGSDVDDFDSAPFAHTPPNADANGISEYIDALTTTYRYWWFDFNDRTNPSGPESFNLKLYLGDYVTLIDRNLSNGFKPTLVDPSVRTESIGGVPRWRRRTKYWTFEAMAFQRLADTDRTEMMRVYSEMGISTPFIVSLDPDVVFSSSLTEWTKYVTFSSFEVNHERFKYYNISMGLTEVIG